MLSQKLRSDEKATTIVALDLQPMSPINGVVQLQADLTHPDTARRVLEHFNDGLEKADLVVCDGAPDVTGLHDLDEYIQSQLLLSALSLSTLVLRPGGTFVAKIFRGSRVQLLFAQLGVFFGSVTCAKPRSSRNSSIESFVVCRNYRTPPHFTPAISSPPFTNMPCPNAPFLAPFVACGDLGSPDSFDSDATYPSDPSRASLDPVQPPTNPPYKSAIEARRHLQHLSIS